MKILIIGSGYLGKALAKPLKEKGHHVTGTTRNPDKALLLKNTFDQTLIWNEASYLSAFENKDVVIFCVAPDTPNDYKETYLENAKRIVNAASSLKHIIYTSSTSVYGDLQGSPATEETPLNAQNPQTQILIDTENTLKTLPQTCIFRLGEIIGPGRTLETRLRHHQGPLPGNGLSITNFSPLTDIIEGILFALSHSLTGLYNLCSPLHVPRKELYEQITKSKKLPTPLWSGQPSLHTGNKTVISEKITHAGFQFKALPWEGILEGITIS